MRAAVERGRAVRVAEDVLGGLEGHTEPFESLAWNELSKGDGSRLDQRLRTVASYGLDGEK